MHIQLKTRPPEYGVHRPNVLEMKYTRIAARAPQTHIHAPQSAGAIMPAL